MPEVESFTAGHILKAVVDEHRCMDKLANTGSTGHRAANIGEGLQQTDVAQKRIAEAFSGGRIIDPGIFEDTLEIG